MNQIRTEAEQLREQLVADRRYLHQCPERGIDLPKTTAYVKKRLAEMGIEAVDCGRSGITALLGDPSKGKVLLLRGDMDSLPIVENNDLPFKAQGENSHMCGHDMHTAMLLGAAQLLKRHESELKGAVKLMFQPGEETAEGALEMIEAGVLKNPDVDGAIAIHVFPFLNAGEMGYIKGTSTASFDVFNIEFQGKGGHSSQPHNSVDPLMMANAVYMELNSLVGKEVAPTETATLTVGRMSGGTAVNIIPDTAKLDCGIRCYNNAVRDHLRARIVEITEGMSRLLRGSCTIQENGMPSVENNPELMDAILPGIQGALGEENVKLRPTPGSGSEDFAYVSLEVPAVFLQLGAKVEGNNYPLHNPNVLLDEDALPCGTAVYVSCAFEYLK